ncbi:MAG: polysaccharide biosynthesis protein PslG [Solirubrobacteraceae bacterium]|nr:polysaccharide biosynthesis protein PslG [Solirubrobacteraceae bacterium]
MTRRLATASILVLAAAAMILSAFAFTPRARSGVPGDFAGVYNETVFIDDWKTRQAELDATVKAGVKLLVEPFDWVAIETAPGRYDFTRYDDFMAEVADRGLQVLPVIYNPPSFRSSAPATNPEHGMYPPSDFHQYAEFVAALVKRYGPHGSFWAQRAAAAGSFPLFASKTASAPIKAWQVWNEPDVPAFWPTGPNPAAYTELLRETAAAIRRIEPTAEVVAAGLSTAELVNGRFLSGMYAAGASGLFDTLSIHPYAPDVHTLMLETWAARHQMDAHGDTGKRLWITEFGWATGGTPDPIYSADEACQSALVGATLGQFQAQQEALHLRGMSYFMWNDRTLNPSEPDSWAFHTGLVRGDGQAKPAYFTYQAGVAAITRGAPVPLPNACPERTAARPVIASHARPRLQLVVGGRALQKGLRRGQVTVTAGCTPRPCSLFATGRLRIRGASSVWKLRPSQRRLRRAPRARMRLALPVGFRKHALHALAHHRKVTALVTVRATRTGSTARTGRRWISLHG